jgi:hypothetical protein
MPSQLPEMTPAGVAASNNSSDFKAWSFLKSERYSDLEWREKFYLCTQHDHKLHDFNGNLITNGTRNGQLLVSKSAIYVPISMRRPSSPYRLAKVITNRFTSMLFGHQRWPSIIVHGDEDTQSFCEALIEATGLPAKMIQARNIGGSVGTVGLSWVFRNGHPIVNVHNGKYLAVNEWEDRDRLIPSEVTEIFQYPKSEWDAEKKKVVKQLYWYRRDWTKDEDIGYLPVKVVQNVEPEWEKDEATSAPHGDGVCHFVWIQNIPTVEEDGLHDYDGLEDNFDALDLLQSILTRGMTLNMDPTLVLKMDADMVKRMGVSKGSDNALAVGKDGDASYLELGGQSVTAGISLFETLRKSVLEVAECVITDPDEAAGGQQSAASIAKVYEPMLAKCDVLREQYSLAIKHLLFQMLLSARKHLTEKNPVVTADGTDEVVDHSGDVQTTIAYLVLPPVITVEDDVDEETGQPTGEQTITMDDQKPGEGGTIALEWGAYFAPSPTDQNQLVTALNMASGGKPVMSQQTASEIFSQSFGRNPADEWKRLTSDKQNDAAARMAQMQAGADMAAAGQVGGPDGMPPGSTPKKPNPFAAPKPSPFGKPGGGKPKPKFGGPKPKF